MSVALKLAIERLERARLTLRMHEAVVEMHRDAGDKVALRSAQARVNGLRTAVGKATFGVRCAGGYA